MIPVERLHALAGLRYTAAYDLAGDLKAELPSDGVILSGDEVAQVREAIRRISKYGGDAYYDPEVVAALSLLDSEET